MASDSSSRASSSSGTRSRRVSSSRDHKEKPRDYNYALPDDSISEWLKCPICLNPFLEPVQAPTCEHIFCSACISMHCMASRARHLVEDVGDDKDDDQESRCPSCRNTLRRSDLKPAATLIRNMVDSLLVRCPHQERGCTYTCERSFVDTHASRDCGWAWVGEYDSDRRLSSSGKGKCDCGKRILRKDWPEHLQGGQCTVQRYPCTYSDGPDGCQDMLRQEEMQEHSAQCPYRPVECSYCRLKIQQQEQEEHGTKCLEAPTVCPMARFGCDWSGNRHYFEDIHKHNCVFLSIQQFLLKNEREMQDLRQENSSLAQLCRDLQQEQKLILSSVQSCMLSLGIEAYELSQPDETLENSRQAVMAAHPASRTNRAPSSPVVTLRGQSGTTIDLASLSSPSLEDIASGSAAITSVSAPASRADLPWEWPESSSLHSHSHSRSHSHHNELSAPKRTIADSIADLRQEMARLTEKMNHFDRRIEDNHVVGVNASFEASRAHEELNSVRHGLHGLRISLLMQQQQQRGVPPSQSPLAEARQVEGSLLPNLNTLSNAMPFSAGTLPPMMSMRRFWNGHDQTKL